MSFDNSDLLVKLQGLLRNLRGYVWKEGSLQRTWINKSKTSKTRKLGKSWTIKPGYEKKKLSCQFYWFNWE